MQKSHFRPRLLTVLLAAALALGGVTHALAEELQAVDPQRRQADELFARGKERLGASDYAAACPLLADSYQLDPATGSLLALALCHERQGKLASAFHDYKEVVARSRREGRPDRVEAAKAQLISLQTRVSTLTIRSDETSPDLTIRVNDLRVMPEQLGHPLPMDGGFLLIEAEAEGKASWQKRTLIADSGEIMTLTIPSLEARAAIVSVPARALPPVGAVAPVVAKAPPPKRARFSAAERTGIALLGAGAVGAAVALGYTIVALHKDRDSDQNCVEDVCTPKGREDRLDARKAGDVATVSVIVATALSTAGLVTFLVGRSHKKDTRRATASKLRPSAWIAPGSAGAAVSGGF